MKTPFCTFLSISLIATNTNGFYNTINYLNTESTIKEELSRISKKINNDQADDNNFNNKKNINNILTFFDLDSSYKKIIEKILLFWNQSPTNYQQYNNFYQISNNHRIPDLDEDAIFSSNPSMLTSIKDLFGMVSSEIKDEILTFFNRLIKIYNQDLIAKLVNKLVVYSDFDGNSAGAFNSIKGPLQSCIYLNKALAFNFARLIKSFNGNGGTALSKIYPFVHEFGHALEFYYLLDSEKKAELNTTDENACRPFGPGVELGPIEKEDNVKTIRDWFQEKYHNPFTSDKALDIFLFLSVPSNYHFGGSYQPDNERKTGKSFNEFVAEAFSYWILTPRKAASLRWMVWDNFFRTTVSNWIS